VSQLEDCCGSVLVSCWKLVAEAWKIVREPRVRGTSAVEIRYRTTTGEDTADWEDLVPAGVSC
jgi:hypothetical protein